APGAVPWCWWVFQVPSPGPPVTVVSGTGPRPPSARAGGRGPETRGSLAAGALLRVGSRDFLGVDGVVGAVGDLDVGRAVHVHAGRVAHGHLLRGREVGHLDLGGVAAATAAEVLVRANGAVGADVRQGDLEAAVA